jgi:glycine cleavage system H protein
VKTVLDIFSPISGSIIETNKEIENSPDLLNSKPYDSWICKIKPSKLDEKINLMSINEYSKYIKELLDK